VVVAVIVPWFLLPAAIISFFYYQYSVLYVRLSFDDMIHAEFRPKAESRTESPSIGSYSELNLNR